MDHRSRHHDLRVKRMDRFDALPRELRDLVNKYGFNLIDQFIRCGVTKPKRIEHLIKSVCIDLAFSHEPTYSKQGQFDD